jgi:hypothetical protein
MAMRAVILPSRCQLSTVLYFYSEIEGVSNRNGMSIEHATLSRLIHKSSTSLLCSALLQRVMLAFPTLLP